MTLHKDQLGAGKGKLRGPKCLNTGSNKALKIFIGVDLDVFISTSTKALNLIKAATGSRWRDRWCGRIWKA